MKKIKYYLVAKEVAVLSGTLTSTYRTANGEFILSEKEVNVILSKKQGKTLASIGIEEISEQKARKLIREGGYKMGLK